MGLFGAEFHTESKNGLAMCVVDSVFKWDTGSVKIGDCDIFTMCFSSVQISSPSVMYTS